MVDIILAKCKIVLLYNVFEFIIYLNFIKLIYC